VHDLIVAGAGPVGLATALRAHRAGLDVVVVEPRAAPIDKACGEGLMPAAVAAFAELGVAPAGRVIRGIRYQDAGHCVRAGFAHGVGRGVRRTDLQAGLAETVQAAGIEICPARIETIEQDAGSVHAAGLRARYLAAADGLHSTIRRQLGLDAPRTNAAPRFGQRAHFAVAPWTDDVEVHWSARAEAYVTPVADDLVGVAVLSSTRAPFTELLAGFPVLRDRLPALPVAAVRGAGPLRQRAVRRVAGRVLLVGDAAGYVDALTGEGIAVGLGCARALVDAVVLDRPEDYEQQWRQASRRYRVITEGLVWAAARPRVRPLIVPAAARAPRLFGLVVRQLGR
jgi:flavin-dependent dehydrogenase